MLRRSSKPVRTASEIRAELDWAVQVLTFGESSSRIGFDLPECAPAAEWGPDFNWDVLVRCRPEQDEAAQVAISYVAEKWNLIDARPVRLHELAKAYREGAQAALCDQAINPHIDSDEAMRKAWEAGFVGSPN